MIHDWFTDAKQSLAVAGPICAEANDLVQSSRVQIEQSTVLWAQIMFMFDAVTEQLDMLQNVFRSIQEFQTQFEASLHESVVGLEQVRKRLRSSLDRLEATRLDPSFSDDPERRRTLKSFVFDDGLEKLEATIAERLRDVEQTSEGLAKEITKLAQGIEKLKKLALKKDVSHDGLEQAHENTDFVVEHAHAMAMLLESLTRHYDLCFKAMNEESGDEELLNVLKNDAQEVPGVVDELYERQKSMEASAQNVGEFKNRMRGVHAQTVEYFGLLHQFVKSQLPTYLDTFSQYSDSKEDHIRSMKDLSKEVGSLVEYYQLFFESYQQLVLEVLRRSRAERAIAQMTEDYQNKLNRAYEDESARRKQFIQECGEFLPSDLWPGLTEPLHEPKIEFNKSDFPELSDSAIEAASKFA